MKTLPVRPEYLRAMFLGKPGIGVDREAKIIRGVVVAEEGPFKSEGRGEFDRPALAAIARMGNEKAAGLKSRWTHPTLSSDGLGHMLGRMKNFRVEKSTRTEPLAANTGGMSQVIREIELVRADLHLDSTAFKTPSGDLATYVMDLATSDPDAFGSSLVLKTDTEMRLDKKGVPLKGEDGEMLPPLWRPTSLHAVDVVDTGDATNSFLSADILDGLPDAAVRKGCELLDTAFSGATREVVKARAEAWLSRYLSHRFGEELAAEPVVDTTPTITSTDDEALHLEIELRRRSL